MVFQKQHNYDYKILANDIEKNRYRVNKGLRDLQDGRGGRDQHVLKLLAQDKMITWDQYQQINTLKDWGL